VAMTAEKAAKRAKAEKKRKKHDQRGKDHPTVVEQAEAIVAKVVKDVGADHALGHKVKELRDGGMAWWQIAYQLELPGSGPNVTQGKSGAARARALYKKTFGELPGDVAARSTKASRASGDGTGAPVVRKPQFNDDQLAATFDNPGAEAEANADIIARVAGHEIRWTGRTVCSDGGELVTEREARVHTEGIKIERVEGKPTILHFREVFKGDRRAQQWRAVRLADVYDIRR
jgi:hypothetical protein